MSANLWSCKPSTIRQNYGTAGLNRNDLLRTIKAVSKSLETGLVLNLRRPYNVEMSSFVTYVSVSGKDNDLESSERKTLMKTSV
jgi:hypothetical protein